MTRIYKQRIEANIKHNFNKSTEISYWSKKLNIDADQLQKTFVQMDYSINKTIVFYQKK